MIVGYINGQSLEIHHSKVVADTVDYLTADFVFQTNEWLDFRKWVHFKKGEEHYQIMLSNDKVTKKDHLNLSQGEWEVYIHGSLENEIITTNKITLNVEATGDLEGLPPDEKPIPPQDLILNLIGDLQDLDTEAKENLVIAINEVLRKIGSGGGGSAGKGIKSVTIGDVDLNEDGFGTGTLTRCLIIKYTDDTTSAIPLPDIFKQDLDINETENGIEITFIDADGTLNIYTITNGKDGADGKDYVLTEEDKNEIANNVVDMFGTSLLSIIGSGVVE